MAMTITNRSKTTIVGLVQDLSDIDTAITDLETDVGDLSLLTTTAKGSLVAAINELDKAAGDIAEDYLEKDDNLASLTDFEVARTNLDVYSTTEVDTEISNAIAGISKFYTVADNAAMMALTGVTAGSYVTVIDDGDGKWARYEVLTVDANGTPLTVGKRNDEDIMLNAQSAADIKTSYESNDDTNALTDAMKDKIDFLTVTSAINLDKVIQSDELTSAAAIKATGYVGAEDKLASEAAVVAMAHEAARLGGSRTIIETLTVTAATITLTHTPKDGVHSVLNFGQVRFVDTTNVLLGGAGAAYDIDLISVVGEDKQFKVDSGSTSTIDGQTVKVQYTYVPV